MLSLLKLRHRILIWGLLQLLPEPKLQGPNWRLIFLGIIGTVLGAVLLLAALVCGLMGLHYYLLDIGIDPYQSLLIISGGFLFATACTGIGIYFCFRKKNHAIEMPKPIDSLSEIKETIGKTIGNLKILKAPLYFNDVIDGFMDGLSNDSTDRPKSKKMMDTIDSLFEKPVSPSSRSNGKHRADHPVH